MCYTFEYKGYKMLAIRKMDFYIQYKQMRGVKNSATGITKLPDIIIDIDAE